jgi:hypothetical protein
MSRLLQLFVFFWLRMVGKLFGHDKAHASISRGRPHLAQSGPSTKWHIACPGDSLTNGRNGGEA